MKDDDKLDKDKISSKITKGSIKKNIFETTEKNTKSNASTAVFRAEVSELCLQFSTKT